MLDVGSSRGHFLQQLVELHPEIERAIGIESDERVIPEHADERISFVSDRFENVDFGDGCFDLIYCCQTLEHAASAREMLSKMFSLLADDGLLFVEVPNTQSIAYPANVDEFFIDKHSFHFTWDVLHEVVSSMPGEIVEFSAPSDILNISFWLRRGQSLSSPVLPLLNTDSISESNLDSNRRLVADYAATQVRNRALLPDIARSMERIAGTMPTSLWGATTILDALVKYGGLDVARFHSVVDTYLSGIFPDQHGIQVISPSELRAELPATVVVLARYSAQSIEQECLRMGIRNVILFEDLMESCRPRYTEEDLV